MFGCFSDKDMTNKYVCGDSIKSQRLFTVATVIQPKSMNSTQVYHKTLNLSFVLFHYKYTLRLISHIIVRKMFQLQASNSVINGYGQCSERLWSAIECWVLQGLYITVQCHNSAATNIVYIARCKRHQIPLTHMYHWTSAK